MPSWDSALTDVTFLESGRKSPYLPIRYIVFFLLSITTCLVTSFLSTAVLLAGVQNFHSNETLTTTHPEINLASFEAGARILSEYTSPVQRGFRWMGPLLNKGNPEDLLKEIGAHKHCWKNRGSPSRFGVSLSHSGLIHTILVEHEQGGILEAPKNIRIWEIKRPNRKSNPHVPLANESPNPLMRPNMLTLLTSLLYDPRSTVSAQNFTFNHIGPPVNEIIVDIVDNWGHSKLTCLSALRVYGIQFPL
ncbi:hypothetical protein CPB86DRAFT_878129 [Serendipita vermifera]|nr:hypothetical protein CPB86DRAFT_878129 [Serendipita vermifera]